MRRHVINCQVVLVPTIKAPVGTIMKRIKHDVFHDYAIDLGVGKLTLNVNTHVSQSNEFWEGQHIYILSEEEILESNWYFDLLTNKIYQAQAHPVTMKCFKKLVMTTDKTVKDEKMLISVGQEGSKKEFLRIFIDEYNKGNVITGATITENNTFKDFLKYKETGELNIHFDLDVVTEAFEVLDINLSDYKLLSIGNRINNTVICHMNTMDNNYEELKIYATKICEFLNKNIDETFKITKTSTTEGT